MTDNNLPSRCTKAALLGKLQPGVTLTLLDTLGDSIACKPRTIHKATAYQVVMYADDKPDRRFTYLPLMGGDKFYLSAGGFHVVSSDDTVLTYAWGHFLSEHT